MRLIPIELNLPSTDLFTKNIYQDVQQETDALRNYTIKYVDEFWTAHYNVRTKEPPKEWGYLGLHIRQYTHVFGIEWYMNRFVVVNGKNRVFSTPLKYNLKTCRYRFNAVREQLKPWEIDLVDTLEPRFIAVRKRLHYHSKLLRTLRYY